MLCSLIFYELKHAKTNKMTCAPSEDPDQCGQSLYCPAEEGLVPKLPIKHTANAQIRQADAKADLSLGWVHRSFCWFCHVLLLNYWRSIQVSQQKLPVCCEILAIFRQKWLTHDIAEIGHFTTGLEPHNLLGQIKFICHTRPVHRLLKNGVRMSYISTGGVNNKKQQHDFEAK